VNFHVIKENDLFLLTDQTGNIPNIRDNSFGYGLFTRDTRVLSRLDVHFSPDAFALVESDDSANVEAVYRYVNKEQKDEQGEVTMPREVIALTRRQFVNGERFYEECSAVNYGQLPVKFSCEYEVAADFVDMFVVRGYQQGTKKSPVHAACQNSGVVFTHIAADGLHDHTLVELGVTDPRARGVTIEQAVSAEGVARLSVALEVNPGDTVSWLLMVSATAGTDLENSAQEATVSDDQNVLGQLDQLQLSREKLAGSYTNWLDSAPQVSGHADFQSWYERGLRDLRMLLTDLGFGPYPVAGVPWYAVPFGRDSLIAAWQLLPISSQVAKGTLLTMAAFQGTKVDPSRDEQPGKIMHELRAGELARSGAVPFAPYYGTIDATPLFLNLAADYLRWTGDVQLLRELQPHADRAFEWLETYGDRDHDHLIEYVQEAGKGIANQGWKDSGDSMVHKDGRLAEAPIALCEVQGYAYRAYTDWGYIYDLLQQPDRARQCRVKAQTLKTAFISAFWLEQEGALALALDGAKEQVASIASNMGHVLSSGILDPERAKRVAERLLADDMFSGFGIRTLAATEVAYNPLSYHNGSIWPHDTSIIVAGLKQCGCDELAARVIEGLMAGAKTFALMRLPELFLGYSKAEAAKPVPYPVSCSPQAWAAGTPAVALQAILGLQPDVVEGTILLRPYLPQGMDRLIVEGIRLGNGFLSVHVMRAESGLTTYRVLENSTGLIITETAGSPVAIA